MIRRPWTGKVELESRRLIFVHHGRQLALEIDDTSGRDEKGSVEDCTTLFTRGSRVHGLLPHRLHCGALQCVVDLGSHFPREVATCITPEILDLPLQQIFLTRRCIGGLRFQRRQLGAVLREMTFEQTWLHVDANDEFSSIANVRECPLQLVHPLRQHRLDSLVVAEKRPHREWHHCAGIGGPSQNAVVRGRAHADPLHVGGKRFDFIGSIVVGADRRSERGDIAIRNETDRSAIDALRRRGSLQGRADDPIHIAQALAHRSALLPDYSVSSLSATRTGPPLVGMPSFSRHSRTSRKRCMISFSRRTYSASSISPISSCSCNAIRSSLMGVSSVSSSRTARSTLSSVHFVPHMGPRNGERRMLVRSPMVSALPQVAFSSLSLMLSKI